MRNEVCGDPEVCVAVLDGPVDLAHPCFRGADVTRIDTLIQEPAGVGSMSKHGTHVASVVFGQPSSGALGLAPRCRGLVLPIFRDSSGYLSQLDLARAIERAVLEGAHIINVSGGERTAGGRPDPLLARALDLCDQSNVLVVAAVGNDGSDCHHVPAAIPTVLAVGAIDRAGVPLQSSNYGELYRSNGVLAPGEAIPGAVPGGAIAPFTGSSFATPIVTGLAALLMSIQRRQSDTLDAKQIRNAILKSAIACRADGVTDCSRYLAGTLNVRGTHALTTGGGRTRVTQFDAGPTSQAAEPAAVPWATAIEAGAGVAPSAEPAPCGGAVPAWGPAPSGSPAASAAATHASPGGGPIGPVQGQFPAPAPALPVTPGLAASAGALAPADPARSGGASGVVGSGCSCGGAPGEVAPAHGEAHAAGPARSGSDAPPGSRAGEGVVPAAVAPPRSGRSLIFAIGNIGFDFGTEARRDTFRQLMERVTVPGSDPPVVSPPNPFDTTQLANYLDKHEYESTKVIWTLNLDLTPIYAIEAELAYADAVYSRLRIALRNQALPADEKNYVSRVSIPGTLTERTVRLYSGQVVPVVVAQPRGLYIWNEAVLVNTVVDAVIKDLEKVDRARVALTVRQMLDKVYYQLRNLGQSPPDRAINFQATNAFVFADAIARGLLSGQLVDCDATRLYSLDTISAEKSAYCRVDSDCWDVKLTFFDPENDQRSRVAFQSTIDVSDEMPVQLAPTHQFLFAS
ncbi:MAG: PatA/PatG family cyanobactin maturation protease [Actinobacteria bacterium]|nr:PatA/PatG family cyanobactin maturation protease [Actinomycetota bacterium]